MPDVIALAPNSSLRKAPPHCTHTWKCSNRGCGAMGSFVMGIVSSLQNYCSVHNQALVFISGAWFHVILQVFRSTIGVQFQPSTVGSSTMFFNHGKDVMRNLAAAYGTNVIVSLCSELSTGLSDKVSAVPSV